MNFDKLNFDGSKTDLGLSEEEIKMVADLNDEEKARLAKTKEISIDALDNIENALPRLSQKNKLARFKTAFSDWAPGEYYDGNLDEDWSKNVLPKWKQVDKTLSNDPKIQKLDNEIEKHKDKDYSKALSLMEERQEYIKENIDTPVKTDNKLNNIINKLETMKKKDPSSFGNKITPGGFKKYRGEQASNLAGKGARVGALLGAGALGARHISEGLPEGVAGGLVGGTTGAFAGGAIGGLSGLLKGKLDKKRGKIKQPGKYNKQHITDDLDTKRMQRESYLRTGDDDIW